MADNYLERRMEDYRSGKMQSSIQRRRVTRSGQPVGVVQWELEENAVLLLVGNDRLRKALVGRLTQCGVYCAFCSVDVSGCAALAQRTGALFVPVKALDAAALEVGVAEVERRRSKMPMLVTDTPSIIDDLSLQLRRVVVIAGPAESSISKYSIIVTKEEDDEDVVADAVLFLATKSGGEIVRIEL